jgi:hypothetical protein
MKMTSWLIIYVLFVHFVSDYVFQSNSIIEYKSKHWVWLMIHVLSYISILTVGILIGSLFFKYNLGFIWKFLLININAHWITEYFTSRRIEKYRKKSKTRNMMLLIGLEQFIILSAIFLSFHTNTNG